MPSTEDSGPSLQPAEVGIVMLFLSIVVGIIAWDEVVAIFFFALLVLVYLLYRILRTVELIAEKL